MKKLITLLVAGCFLASCNYIAMDSMVVQGPNGCTVPEPTFVPRTNPVKKVVVEEFTGHFCGSCPQGHQTIDNMYANPVYQEQMIVVAHHSAHAGDFTLPWSTDPGVNPQQEFIYDFRNPVSSEIDYKYNTIGYPLGMINRKIFGSSRLTSHTTWQSHVDDVLSATQEMDIQIKPFYSAVDQTICVYYFTEALTNLSGDFKILLFLTEDSIIQWQKNAMANPIYVPNYVHKHVMRASFNGVTGTAINTNGSIADGETNIDGYSISIAGTDWDIDHLYVVGMVYNVATEDVLQAEQVKLIP